MTYLIINPFRDYPGELAEVLGEQKLEDGSIITHIKFLNIFGNETWVCDSGVFMFDVTPAQYEQYLNIWNNAAEEIDTIRSRRDYDICKLFSLEYDPKG